MLKQDRLERFHQVVCQPAQQYKYRHQQHFATLKPFALPIERQIASVADFLVEPLIFNDGQESTKLCVEVAKRNSKLAKRSERGPRLKPDASKTMRLVSRMGRMPWLKHPQDWKPKVPKSSGPLNPAM